MRFNQLLLCALLLISSVAFHACDDDDATTRLDSDVSVEFDYSFNGEEFTYDQVYDVNGTAVTFQTVQFYVGGIVLHPEDGEMVNVTDKYLLVKPTSGAQDVVNVDKKHYHMAEFFVGVSAADNDQTENDFDKRDPATDPLARQNDPPMHWNWNAGYLFVRIDAMVDLDADGTPETVMEYHLGRDEFLSDVSVMLHTDVEQDQQDIVFDFDVAKLFTGLDVSVAYSMHTGDDPVSARIFADNIASAISKK